MKQPIIIGRLEHITAAIMKALRLSPGDEFTWVVGGKTYECKICQGGADTNGLDVRATVIREITPELKEEGPAVRPGIRL